MKFTRLAVYCALFLPGVSVAAFRALESGRKVQAEDCQWNQIADLDGQNLGDRFGEGAVISGDGTTMAIGSPFASTCQVFTINDDGSGTASQLGTTITVGDVGDFFGHSVAISMDGRMVAVAARFYDRVDDSNDGTVSVFQYISADNTWSQVGNNIDGEAPGDEFGLSVSLSADGTIVAIGAVNNDSNGNNESGHVRVYQFQNSDWVQLGSDIDGIAAGDRLGQSVSLSADGLTFAVVAIVDTGSDTHISRVFQYDASQGWMQMGGDIEVDGVAEGGLTRSLSLSADGLTVSVGSQGSPSVDATIFTLSPDNDWVQLGNQILVQDGGEEDRAGLSTSLAGDGRTVAVGAIQDVNEGAGYVRVFRYSSVAEDWIQVGSAIEGEAPLDRFGFSVSLSNDGTRLVVGDPDNFDEEGELRGHARAFSVQSTCLLDSTSAPTTASPAGSPTPMPTSSGTERLEQFDGINIEFVGVGELTFSETSSFEDIHEQWYEEYFVNFGAVHGVRQMETTVQFREQISEPGDSTNSVRTTITFDQSISYIELDSSVPAQELISIPFLNVDEKQRYGELLADNIGAFSDVQFPINRPVLSVSRDTDPPSDSISTGATVGIAVGAIVGITLAAYLAYFLVRGRQNNGNENGDSPVVAADISPPHGEVVPEPATVIAVPYLPDYKDQVRSVVPNGTPRTNTQLPAGPSYKQGEKSSNYQRREDP